MHAIRSECHGHPVSASRGETKEQNCTWGKRGRKKGTGGSLAECQAPANEGRTGARSRALGSWASFYCAFLFSQGQRVPAACYSGLIGVVWSTRRAHCAGVEGGGGAAGGGRPQERCLHHGGSGCRAEGHHLWPLSRGCIPQATLIQSTSVAVVPTTQPPALLSPRYLSSSLVLSLTFCAGCVYFWTPRIDRLRLSSFTKIYFPLAGFSSWSLGLFSPVCATASPSLCLLFCDQQYVNN